MGGKKLKVIPGKRLAEDNLSKVIKSLNKKFHAPENQMDLLGIYLCATKK